MRLALRSSSALALLAAVPAAAQTAPAAPAAPAKPAAAAPATIENVVVTANKVKSTLQKTPQAITVLSGVALDRQAIQAPKDLDNIVPGLVVNTTPSNPLSISIRGAGYEGIENTSAQPGVSYNQNGVYIASPISLNANFLDLQSLEVLRGPQGTVLGQNSDGGAINVTTVRPELGVYSGSAEASAGSYDYDRFRGTANLPIGDTFALRLAVQQEQHDQFMNSMAAQQQRHEDALDTMARGTRMSMDRAGEATRARTTAASDVVDFALDRQTVMDTNTGRIYKVPDQVTAEDPLVVVHGNGTPR